MDWIHLVWGKDKW